MDEEGQAPAKCFNDENHDIENMMSDQEHIVYQCTKCGRRMEYLRNVTPELIIGENKCL